MYVCTYICTNIGRVQSSWVPATWRADGCAFRLSVVLSSHSEPAVGKFKFGNAAECKMMLHIIPYHNGEQREGGAGTR